MSPGLGTQCLTSQLVGTYGDVLSLTIQKHFVQWHIQHRNPTVKILTRQGRGKTQGFPELRRENSKRQRDGEKWVENGEEYYWG